MTELIYYQDQYKIDLEARVVKIDGNKILLDKTIFIPQTNNEPGDFGIINSVEISSSLKDENNIWHIFEKPFSFQVGDIVKLELDWNKRLAAIRFHSALHLLAGVFEAVFEKRAVAGAIKEKEKQAYLVFKEEISNDIINKAIELANEYIYNNLEIKSYWDEKREGFRWTQVGDYPAIPDGGLHVKTAKEIGKINLISIMVEGNKQKIVISI